MTKLQAKQIIETQRGLEEQLVIAERDKDEDSIQLYKSWLKKNESLYSKANKYLERLEKEENIKRNKKCLAWPFWG